MIIIFCLTTTVYRVKVTIRNGYYLHKMAAPSEENEMRQMFVDFVILNGYWRQPGRKEEESGWAEREKPPD